MNKIDKNDPYNNFKPQDPTNPKTQNKFKVISSNNKLSIWERIKAFFKKNHSHENLEKLMPATQTPSKNKLSIWDKIQSTFTEIAKILYPPNVDIGQSQTISPLTVSEEFVEISEEEIHSIKILEALLPVKDPNYKMQALLPQNETSYKFDIEQDQDLTQVINKFPQLRGLAQEIQKDLTLSLSLSEFSQLLLFKYNSQIVNILSDQGKKEVGADELILAQDALMTLQTNTRFHDAIKEFYTILDDYTQTNQTEGTLSELMITVLQYYSFFAKG